MGGDSHSEGREFESHQCILIQITIEIEREHDPISKEVLQFIQFLSYSKCPSLASTQSVQFLY